MAALLVLDPIFEADLALEQYAYRRDRGAHEAGRAVHSLLNTGHTQVVEAGMHSNWGYPEANRRAASKKFS